MEVDAPDFRPRSMASERSLLDDLGEEVTGIIAPVSLCMAVTVLLVRLLNPDGVSSSNSVIIASVAYQEQADDSSGRKLGGALLNAIIFVGVIAGMTIILFLLFKYKCYKFIYAYMGFAVFNIFFFITGALFIQVMQVINLHIDAFSLAYGLFNFSVVGTLGLLFMPIPLLAKQVYLIWVGIIVAYIFTFIPEWTAWVILVFMALYDIAAVLIPGGPLKGLVELAISRKEELPALIYEARPAGGRPYVRGWGNRDTTGAAEPNNLGGVVVADGAPGPGAAAAGSGAPGPARAVAEGATAAPAAVEMRRPGSRPMRVSSGGGASVMPAGRDAQRPVSGGGAGGADVRRLVSGGWTSGPSRLSTEAMAHGGEQESGVQAWAGPTEDEAAGPLGGNRAVDGQQPPSRRLGAGPGASRGPRPVGEGKDDDEWEPVSPTSETGTLRGRVARALSTNKADAAAARVTPRKDSYQEPLIPSDMEDSESRPEREAAARAGGPLSAGDRAGAGPSTAPAGGSGQRMYSTGGQGGKGFEGAEAPPQDPANMGVRAVAPAIGRDQLAEAVRRNNPSGSGLQPPPPPPASGDQRAEFDTDSHDNGHDLPDAIKLGLGDFIFYSMLVGRAAMYDFMTVFSSYLAIIAGLGLTLLCLAMYQKALPALPFSIALGVAFYFLTRLLLEPFLVPMAVNLVYF